MSARLKFANAVLCDYVAEGARNKPILIGVFSGDVVVERLPASLNFGLYLEYMPPAAGAFDLVIEILNRDAKIASITSKVEDARANEPVLFVIPMFNLGITAPTEITILASRSGFKRTQVLSKKILAAPAP